MKRQRRIIAIMLIAGEALVATAIVFAAVTLFVPQTAYAQVAPTPQPVVPIANPDQDRRDSLSKAWQKIKDIATYATMNALLTGLNTMTQRIAANTATWIVSGGNGQTPLAYITGWNNWHDNVILDSVSDSVNLLTTKYAGFGLCQPLDLTVSLRIKLGIARFYTPKPSCSFNNFWNSVLATGSNISSGRFLSGVSAGFEMGQSSLSVALNTPYAVVNKATNKYLDEAAQRATSPFKPLTDYITGNVKTPAQMIEEAAKEAGIENPNQADQGAVYAAINKSDLLAAVGTNALKIFTSTLTQKVLDKYLKGGMLNGKEVFCGSSYGQSFDLCRGIVNENFASGTAQGSPGVELAAAYFSNIIFPPSPVMLDDYSPISELSSCPPGTARGIWNCVIDQPLVTALSGKEGSYFTVREAVRAENGSLLHGTWELLPPSDSRSNDSDCYTKAYCYYNLQKLRRMRIIPVGWEMAAQKAGEQQNGSITLQAAMDAFMDVNSPYYHLVDPDWVLKVPITQCRQQVSGQTLVAPDAGERAQVCVDAPSCIKEDSNGKCVGGFGYCTREHTIWQIDAQECPPQFATCNAYADPKGKKLSALSNTLDASYCSAQNAGCKPYAAVGSPSGWTNGSALTFLASSAPSCDAGSSGCRSLTRMATASTANLLPNPGLEATNADGTSPARWASVVGDYTRDGVSSFDGLASFHVASGGGSFSLGGYYGNREANAAGRPQDYVDIAVQPKTLYTLSFYARGQAAGSGELIIKAFDSPFYAADHTCPDGSTLSTCLQDMTGDVSYLPTCTSTGTGAPTCTIIENQEFTRVVPSSAFYMSFPLSAGYERYNLNFATSSNTQYLGFTWSGSDYYLDAFQLEAGPTATLFHIGGTDALGDGTNIKVPPDYLGCTGEPEADAGRSCGNYARVCRQSEVGCDSFSPDDGGTAITAVTSTNDVCPAECVGYDTFRQEKTLWEASRFPLYFIPSTAKSCQLSQAGCDEFTNLEKVASGGEAREYYTYLRACRQPDAANDGTYFTWEGSDVAGYQLKSYTLRNNPPDDGTMFLVDNIEGVFFRQKTSGSARGPVYLVGTDPAACTAEIYRPADGSASANPDCREFIDADGNIFYRLLPATVASTLECKTYRKTVSTQPDCVSSGGVWSGGSNACEYYVLSKESKACPASANGCRAFIGNHGGNSRAVFSSDFENDNADGWIDGEISGEATAVGGHSYAMISGTRSLAVNGASSLRQGNLYTLTFWAKGSGTIRSRLSMNGDVSAVGNNIFADSAGTVTPPYALTTEWQRYVLGPIAMDWAPAASDILLLGADGAGYFDNIELDEVQDKFALVKDSWRTPASCDATSAGQPLAQAQLGCSAYSNRAGTKANLKSFDHLCRSSSIGCEALVDSQGTGTPFASYRNVKCTLTSGGAVAHGPCLVNDKTVCTVLDAEESCRFDFEGLPSQQLMDYSADGTTYSFDYSLPDVFVIPADTTRYLVNDGSKNCDAAAAGCTALGDTDISKIATCTLGSTANAVRECSVGGSVQCYVAPGAASCTYRMPFTVNGSTAYKIIDPARLSTQLCTVEAIGCNSWTDNRGKVSYFKDPGEAQCEYKDKAKVNGINVSGWFKKGTEEPCDPTYVRGGTDYGIRKNGDQEFEPGKFAGVCKAEFSGCSEFTDHSDLGGGLYPQGRPIYYIKDSRIDAAVAKCNNQVSKKQGCLALDETSNPNKTIDTVATYLTSEKADFALVQPVDGMTLAPTDLQPELNPPGPRENDANIILKVKRDRECTEWLECNTDQTVIDAGGRDTTRCLSVGSCLEKGADGRCINWGSLADGNPVLNAGFYARRDVTSSGSDYSGMSIPDLPPIKAFRQSAAPTAVGFTLNVSGENKIQTCKAYPESDSPFPKSVLVDPNETANGTRKTGYAGANVCELQVKSSLTGSKDCECAYRKVTYGSTTVRYYPTNAESGITANGTPGEIKAAICAGGPYDGSECVALATGNRTETNLTCSNGSSDGSCEPFDKIDSVLGQKGYCLEEDKSLAVNGSDDNACITWLPIDSPKGLDTANQFTSAAFIPKIGQERYCAAPAKYCVARDCQQMPLQQTLCMALKTTAIVYNAETGDQFATNTVGEPIANPRNGNCFDPCNLGADASTGLNTRCEARENVCGNIVINFCKFGDTAELRGPNAYGYLNHANEPRIRQTKACTDRCAAGDVNCRIECRNIKGGYDQATCEADAVDYANANGSVGRCQVTDTLTGIVSFNYGDSQCASWVRACKLGAAKLFCLDNVVKKDPSCTTFEGDAKNVYCFDLYSACQQSTEDGMTLCRNLEKNNCFSNYGGSALCSHDVPGTGYTAAFAAYASNPLYNTSAYCGVDGYTLGPAPASSDNEGGYDLASCATGGTKFCGDSSDSACPVGQVCAPVNNLSVHQTEYTQEETTEWYGKWIPGTSFVAHEYDPPPFVNPDPPAFEYTTIPLWPEGDGAHSAFGTVNAATVPVISSPSLRFSVDKAEGSWMTLFNQALATSSDPYMEWRKQHNSFNYSQETKSGAPVIGPYPLDLVGMYYFGKVGDDGSSAAVSYKLTAPDLLLASQIDRVTVQVLSFAENGLCRYNTGVSGGPRLGQTVDSGTAGNFFGEPNMYNVCSKSFFGNNGYLNGGSWYGYDPFINRWEQDEGGDDMKLTSNGYDAYVTLSSANNWSSQISGERGQVRFTLLVSDATPKRVTGIKVDANVNKGGAYIYVGGLDVHLFGPVCGEAVYVGSSNPTAEDNVAVAYTDSVNNITPPVDFFGRSPIGGTEKSVCNPWGAFASTSPLTVVTSSALSAVCESAKGAIYAGITELRTLFAAVPAVGRFMDLFASKGQNNPFYGYLKDAAPLRAWAIPSNAQDGTVGPISINGFETGDVLARGSLRADLKFYAKAHADQMPIKSVQVNWSDSSSDNVDPGAFNYYKNRASGCDGSHFDLSSGACETKPFSYSHVYSGSCFSPARAPAGGYPEIGVREGDPICVYQPSVTIIDNWGHPTDADYSGRIIVAP